MQQRSPEHVNISITLGTIVKAVLFIILIGLLFHLRQLVLVVLTAVVLASSVEPPTRWLIRYKVPRIPAVIFIYAVILSTFFGIVYFFLPPVLNESTNLLSQLPDYIDLLEPSGGLIDSSSALLNQEFSLRELLGEVRSSFSTASEGIIKTATTVFGGVVSFILIIVFSFYLAVQETGVDDFLRIITPTEHRDYVVNLWRRTQAKIGRWMQGQLILALIVGVLTYLGLSILGVPYALVLAVIAALFELIPVFGPVLSAIPAIAIAAANGGAGLGILTTGLFIIIQQFENHLIYPLVVKKVVGVPAILVILALIIGWELAGFLGIILSVPVATALQELVSDIQNDRFDKKPM